MECYNADAEFCVVTPKEVHMRLAFILLGGLLLQGQTVYPGIASQQWFAQHLPPLAPAPAKSLSAPVPQSHAFPAQPPSPMSHALAVCKTDALALSWYQAFPSTALAAAQQHFVQSQIEKVQSDLTARRC